MNIILIRAIFNGKESQIYNGTRQIICWRCVLANILHYPPAKFAYLKTSFLSPYSTPLLSVSQNSILASPHGRCDGEHHFFSRT
jgi:hypothetical protein